MTPFPHLRLPRLHARLMRTALSAALFLSLLLAPATAENTPDRDSDAIIDGYHDFQTLRETAHNLADAHETVTVEKLGTTLGGRGVGLITLAHPDVDPATNPAILILGQEHAPHLLGSELALRIAADLAEREDLLRRVTFYIIPRPSPDASEAFFTLPYYQRTTNLRPTDDDNDGLHSEDGPNDLNDDGYVTQLRIADPEGTHTPHADDDRVMVKAPPDTPADERYTIITEAKDDDGDERIGEDGPGGVAFDLNFPFEYPYFKRGAGPHQVSEVETRSVADFAFDHPNIAAVFTFSPRDNLLHPWKPNPGAEQQRIKTTLQSDDAPYYGQIIERYKTHHAAGDPPPAMEGGGDFVQWAYFHYGRLSLAARAWAPPKAEGEDAPDHRDLAVLDWFEREGMDGFVDWQVIDHPDYPGKRVEVGGFKPFVRLNPPAEMLDDLADTHGAFVVDLAEMLPRLVLRDVKVEPLDGGLVRVTVRVVNEGSLPSVMRMGAINKVPEPVRLKLELPDDPDAELLTGDSRVTLPALRGNGGSHEQTWLIRTEAELLQLTVEGPAVHGDSHEVEW
ncbi:MAG: M14 family metallopeptidase [Phycisphaeraceae bacterium]